MLQYLLWYFHCGSANQCNRSCCKTGYHGGQGEAENGLLQRTMEALRREAERQDYYGGIVALHSLSGGTGSGEHYDPAVNVNI